jgi:hypothetical protein
MTTATRFPLSWPAGRKRTLGYQRQRPKFKVRSFAVERDNLLDELRRLGATGVILSTNVELRGDGLPYSGRRNPDDPGVVVYFARKGKNLAFACDKWVSVEENLRAVTDACECIRMIERRGTGEMVDAAFQGFQALPPAKEKRHWWEVLGVAVQASTVTITEVYRELSKSFHPDRNPGDDDALKRYLEVQEAWEQVKKERGL